MSCLASKIKCAFFCLFDPREGPKMGFQIPDGYVKDEDFHGIQNYLIPKEELQQKLITVNVTLNSKNKEFDHKILGCPVYISNTKYKRNAFIFNVCFVFDSHANTSSYEKVLKKLVQYFTVLETESAWLSENGKPSCRLPPVRRVLEQVMQQLNFNGTCAIPIDGANTIHLKLVPCYKVPPVVRDHDVPILTFKPEDYHSHQWDLATQQVLTYIDGFKHILQIAVESNADIRLVKLLIQNLLYFQLVKIIPVFLYSNVYMTTSDIQKLYTSNDLQNRCMQAVALSSKTLPTFDEILRLYSCFTPGNMTTVKQICVRHSPKKSHIDIRKLVQFGVVNNLLRRIHKYPVNNTKKSSSESGGGNSYLKYCDGTHSYDEICCALGMSYEELDTQIENDPNILICWK